MPTTHSYSRSPTSSVPRPTTGKSPSKIPLAYPAPLKTSTHAPHHRGSSAATSAVPSLVSDSGSSSSDRSSHGASDVDLLDLLDIKLSDSVRAEPLDRSLARQAQTYGLTNLDDFRAKSSYSATFVSEQKGTKLTPVFSGPENSTLNSESSPSCKPWHNDD